MAIHKNLIIESDMTLSSKIGRVLFVDLDNNPGITFAEGDIIHKNREKLVITKSENIRLSGKSKMGLGLRVERL